MSLRLAARREVPRPAFATTALRELEAWSAKIDGAFPEILAEATRRSSLLGRWITVRAGETVIEGIAESLDDGGQLLVRDAHGALHTLAAGEVTVLP